MVLGKQTKREKKTEIFVLPQPIQNFVKRVNP